MDTEIGCFMKPEVIMQRRKFSREFKVEAVKLVRERGVSVAQAGRDLGVHENVLRKWGSAPTRCKPSPAKVR
jgi:transposase